MEGLTSPQGQKQNLQFRAHKSLLGGTQKDLWLVVREGSLTDVELALTYLKKTGGNINSRNAFGLTSLHIATWRNHIPIVRRLLAAGADPDVRDGESGWSSLHRALHFGHLAVASLLLQSGASITLEDTKSRTPVDLLSGPVSQIIGNAKCSVATEVFSWGSGANYQLGTGNTHLQKSPCKLDSLHGSFIKLISAAKFHSVAVSAQGELYTWGFGRGGRLGHPEFDIHSGQAAVITPRQVISGLGSRRVRAIAAAKHHNVVALESGEVYTWGSNREGQLGYTSVDTQPTPRRVSSLKAKIVAIAAANKHSAAVSETGEVFTWGSNKEGQLGYGTSNSGSNYTPRLVEYLKGKVFTGVAAAKYHTIVLGADGEVYTWGHRLVTPRRVVVARNLKKSGNTLIKFHRMERLHVVDIAAGMVHSMALTDDGAIFYWVSADPDLRCQQLYSFCGRKVVSISSGKFWSAAVTSTGDVYMWDGKKAKDKPPLVTRLHGAKRATAVSVGETHLLIIGSIYHPAYPSIIVKEPLKSKHEIGDELGELDEAFLFDDIESGGISCSLQKDDVGTKLVPSLKSLCEKVAAQSMVEPRNAVQLLEIADSLGADDLRKHCEEIVVRNLDYIFTVSSHALASASLDILVQLEKLLDMKSLEPWSNRRLPTPTATLPAIINSEEDDSDSEFPRTRDDPSVRTISKKVANKTSHSFLQPIDDGNHVISKQVRALLKKLQQIDVLEAKQLKGHNLDNQQIAKLHTRSALENSLAKLGVPIAETKVVASTSVQNDGKGGKKLEMSRKQRKIKQKASQAEVTFGHDESEMESNIKDSLDDSLDVGFSEVSEQQGVRGPDATLVSISQESPFCSQRKDYSDLAKGSLSVASKKKSRKGGLSMFLTGGLDEIPKEVISPPPKSDGPAWGGAKISKVSASLRKIQDEQRNTKENLVAKSKDKIEELSFEDGSSSKVLLSSFLPSSPIPVVSLPTAQSCDGEKSTPPWSASGTPPLPSRPSLRDIQLQQQGKWPQSLSQSPKTKTAGFSVCTGQGSPSDSSGQNRWFKPEVNSPSSIRSIQIEEKAMKDLRRFYSNVKLVTDQSQRPC